MLLSIHSIVLSLPTDNMLPDVPPVIWVGVIILSNLTFPFTSNVHTGPVLLLIPILLSVGSFL